MEAAAKQPENIERGLVCPVQILQHQHGRRHFRHFAGERRQHLMWPATALHRSSSSPPVACATSTNGPSARGVNSASQPPQRIRVAGRCCSQNRRTTAVLPTPASPRSSTSRPCPSLSTLAAKSPNTRRCSDRSNNSSDVTDVLIADFSTVSTPRTQTPILRPRVSTRNPDTQTPRHRANRSSRWAPISASTATNAESCNLPCRVLRQPGRILTGVTTRREENELLERPSRAQGGVSGGAGILVRR